MKNSTIYASPTPPQLDPRPHADLRAQTRQLAGEHLRNVELAPAIRRSQELQNSLLTEYAGDSPENIELLKKCLQEVSIMGINFVIPKRRVLLSVHEILRLSNLGFRFGKLDPDFEIHLQQGRRIPFFRENHFPSKTGNKNLPVYSNTKFAWNFYKNIVPLWKLLISNVNKLLKARIRIQA